MDSTYLAVHQSPEKTAILYTVAACFMIKVMDGYNNIIISIRVRYMHVNKMRCAG